MDNEETDKLAREMKKLENIINVLDILPMLKKGYTVKSNPQIKIQLEYIGRDICPFCQNLIDWKKLEKLILKYTKELEVANKHLKEINRRG